MNESSNSVLSRSGVSQLTLTNFRSYCNLRLDCDTRPVVITGPNGAGKTNILEAISFLNPGRGLRSVRLQDCLNQQNLTDRASEWGIAATIIHQNLPLEIGTSYRQNNGEVETRRSMRLQHAPCSQGELLNYIRIIWQTPQMDRLFVDGGAVRRKFLDRLVYLTDPLHVTRVQKYEHVVRERLKILKSGWINETAWLDRIEQQMAELTVAIVYARQEIIEKLMQAENWAIGSFPKAHLALTGFTENLMTQLSFLEVEDQLCQVLKAQRLDDYAAGRTATGAHRSQIDVIYRDKNQRVELCSTGEQKALLLSIIMAACRLQVLRHEGAPIVLLDEVVAHLDTRRRGSLFEEIIDLGLQVWITGTDQNIFDNLGRQVQYFKIAENKIARYN